MNSFRIFRFLDFRMLLTVFFLLSVSLLFIYSATYRTPGGDAFVYKQMIWLGLGMSLFVFILKIDFRTVGSMAYFFYMVSLFLLILVLVIGSVHKGARSWFDIGPFAFQPSELSKIGIVFMLARFLADRSEDRSKMRYVIFTLLLAGLPIGLIMLEPDLGTALVLIPVLMGMLFVAGARMRYLLAIVAIGLAILPIGWSVLHQYQRQRLLVFINPNMDPLGAGYNAIQSKIAVGSGGLYGKGWLQGTQSQLHFLPERHTDFIFSVVGEEWGFLGCGAVLIGYIAFLLSGFKIARNCEDLFGRFLAVGLSLLIASHVIINTGMTIGIMPITGIPLPFMSYGGSHLLAMMACLGFLQNIHLRKSFV